jgi:uncharacterized protein DUF3597
MSIFGSIVSAIFHHAGSPPSASSAAPASGSAPAPSSPSGSEPEAALATQPAAPAGAVDVAVVMDKLTAQSSEKGLDWRHSIVDMMKLLNLDSSLHARKELAQELHYSGNMNDSASMNVWLHGQVMTKLAQNGGKVPSDLMH